jgi:serine/threonine protein kinase
VTDLLRDKSLKLSFKQRMSFARDAALGMNWLHNASPPILHLDLKCSNLLGTSARATCTATTIAQWWSIRAGLPGCVLCADAGLALHLHLQ